MCLGFWQLDRAKEKAALLERYSIGKERPVVELKNLAISSEMEYRLVKVRGHFDFEHQFLWENQFHEHRLGYYVIAPFILEDRTIPNVLLVNRGWIPAKSNGSLPDIPQGSDKRWIQGFVYFPPARSFQLGEDKRIEQNGWPKVISVLNLSKIQKTLSIPVASFLLQDTAKDVRWVRSWKPVVFGPEKHRGYAFQWFMLAVVWCVMFLYFLYHENTRH